MKMLKPPAEVAYKEQLDALKSIDTFEKPVNWRLSPRMVRDFIVGRDEAIEYEGKEVKITRKYYGNDPLIERCIVTLAGNRGLMLVGEPGTAKSMLSELLSAAISGDSSNTVQGTAGTTEDMVKYSWNYAMLLAKGPSRNSLIPSPLMNGMENGALARVEEITRCPSEIQDSLISIMSDKVLNIPELGDNGAIYANAGFNVIATANTRDKGVNEMSSALKRRFNFETVEAINNLSLELEIIEKEAKKYYKDNNINMDIDMTAAEILTTTFHELREGHTREGARIEQLDAVMSTAEAVSVFIQTGLKAYYYNDKTITMDSLVENIVGAVIKENKDNVSKLENYFNNIVKEKAREGELKEQWKKFYEAKKFIK